MFMTTNEAFNTVLPLSVQHQLLLLIFGGVVYAKIRKFESLTELLKSRN